MASKATIQYAKTVANDIRYAGPLLQLCMCGSIYLKHYKKKCLFGPGYFKPEPITFIDIDYYSQYVSRSINGYNDNSGYVQIYKYQNNKKVLADEFEFSRDTLDLDQLFAVGVKAYDPLRKRCQQT